MRRNELQLPLMERRLPQNEKDMFIAALRKKAATEWLEIPMNISAFTVGGIAGSAFLFVTAPIALMLLPIFLFLERTGMVTNAVGLWKEAFEGTALRVGQAVGGLAAVSVGMVIGGIGALTKMIWLQNNRNFIYSQRIVIIVYDAIKKLAVDGQHHLIDQLCQKIILSYGNSRNATAESKELLCIVYNRSVSSTRKSQALSNYLCNVEKLEMSNPINWQDRLFSCNFLINQGKRLFNTIVREVLSDENIIPENMNIRKRRDSGFAILMLSPLVKTNRINWDVAFHIAGFLCQNPPTYEKITSILDLVHLQRTYKKNVGFFNLNRSNKIFRYGENYNMALFRMREDARNDVDTASHKTLTALSLLNTGE